MVMRILFIHQYVGSVLGGTERHVKELAQRFSSRGHEVEVVTARSKTNNLSLSSEIKVKFLPSLPVGEEKYLRMLYVVLWYLRLRVNSFTIVVGLWLLWRYLVGERWDVISVHWVNEAFLLRILKKIMKIPYVFVLEGYTHEEAEEARRADGCITISNYIAEKCVANHGFEPVVIPLGVDFRQFSPFLQCKDVRDRFCGDREFFVLSVGRLVDRKDYPYIIRAAARVVRRLEGVKFIAVGEGPQRPQLQELIDNLGLTDAFLLIGSVSDRDLPKYYCAADIFVHYPEIQQFEVVNIEAMACGTPIVGSDTGAAREVIGDAGILIPPKDEETLSMAIIRLLENPNLRECLASRSIERVTKKFAWDDLIVKYESVYRSLCTQRR